MTIDAAAHPGPDLLAAFNDGSLPTGERAAVEEHVAGCDACCAALAALGDGRLAGLARQAAVGLTPTREVDVSGVPPELTDHPVYRVLGELGAGGMGVVYRAEHRVMGRVVALKVVARRYTASPAAAERFRREVRAAAQLGHPNIVTAHDAGEAHGLHFLVMEFIEGVSLDRLVRRKGPLPVATACQCVRQAAHGLQHAHDRGMVHRDIKPHNLMVTRKGQVKVLDFGLARVAAEADPPAEPGGTPRPERTVTSPSLLLGTPDYLAPEQARNAHAVDTRADIDALGCVLYFLLTGRPPFAGSGTALEKMLAHVQDEPADVRTLRPDVPEELAAILRRMMAKDPAGRFATAAEVAAVLKPFPRSESVIDDRPDLIEEPPAAPEPAARIATPAPSPRPAGRRRRARRRPARRPWPLIVGGGLAVILLGVIGIILGFRGGSPGTGSGKEGGGGPPVAATGKSVLFVVPHNGLWYPDYGPARKRLEASGVKVVTASTRLGECRVGPPGAPAVTPDQQVAKVRAADYAAVLFCGQDVSEYISPTGPGYDDAERRIKEARGGRCVLGAICTGQGVLWKFGALDNRTVAFCPRVPREKLLEVGAKPSSQRVATDGRLVTAANPEDAEPFADAILAAIEQ